MTDVAWADRVAADRTTADAFETAGRLMELATRAGDDAADLEDEHLSRHALAIKESVTAFGNRAARLMREE